MKCIYIFNNLNDIIYAKYDKKFAKRLNKFAREQGLLGNEQDHESDFILENNVIMQLFSPLVTSQRIMSSQFGNSYSSCQCHDGLNIVFEQYMDHMFVSIAQDEIVNLKRLLGVCICFIRHFCGPDVSLLQSNKQCSATLTHLLDSWTWLRDNDQAVLVEAVEQLMVNADLSSATLRALQEATDKLKHYNTEYSKVHAMIFVQNKFLSLYSSRNAQDLSAADILFVNLLCMLSKADLKRSEPDNEDSEMSEEFYSPSSSPQTTPTHSLPSYNPRSFQILLAGTENSPKCLPHVCHIDLVGEGVNLVILIQLGSPVVSSGLYESFLYLSSLQNIEMQKDLETLQPAFENLDMAIKKTNDGLKKNKNQAVEGSHKKLMTLWDFIKKRYQEFVRNGDMNSLLRAESCSTELWDVLKELLMLTCFDLTALNGSVAIVKEIVKHVENRLANFSDFLKVKALRNLSLGSASLTINKYLEEFPGLVHFIYIDRINHRITAPSLDFNSEETVTLTKKKIWSMVQFSNSHLKQGQLSHMWKDTTFNYSYFLWFEDKAGSPLKPKTVPTTNAPKSLPQPGILYTDFYKKLIETCFPKMPTNKVRCYELFCIHLGLATSSCVLEHTRRLAATIWEINGVPNNPMDLL